MKTPSQYPVLDGRAIDQWKVTELKEELKKRKLTIKGLKEDLVKRLDEALRAEKDDEEQNNNGVEDAPEPQTDDEPSETEADVVEAALQGTFVPSEVDGVEIGEAAMVTPEVAVDPVNNDEGTSLGVDAVSVEEDGKDGSKLSNQDEKHEEKEAKCIDDQPLEVEMSSATVVPPAGVEDNQVSDNTNTISETVTGELGLQHDKMEIDNEDIKPSHNQDVKLNTSYPNNQVSEVNTNLGFPVKSNSIYTDSVSVNEKNKLKDNPIADNVKLELDVKLEIVQPSSSNLVHEGGESHPTDVEGPHENKVYVEDADKNVTILDISQKNHSSDLGSPEKLNLDRSSGDDSMDEDTLEGKQIEPNYNSEMGEKTDKSEVTSMKDEGPSAAVATDLLAEVKTIPQNSNVEAPLSEKRKLPEEVNGSNESSKRVRRWKSENKNTEPHISNMTAKDVPELAAVKRTFNRSYSAASNDSPKEREVPPSIKAATNSLRIDRFLRPFTLKAVQELLGKTGTVSSFWMDQIKTHCYVTYSCIEEAVATRNAVYNLQWPPNGGRNLVAEYVDPEEVKMRVEAPSQPPAPPVNSGPTKASDPPLTVPQPSPRQHSVRQRLTEEQQPSLPPPPPPPLSHPALARERAQPPLPREKVEAPIVTLDDLFRKTKATPRIYYLPLSEEQVTARLEERRKKL